MGGLSFSRVQFSGGRSNPYAFHGDAAAILFFFEHVQYRSQAIERRSTSLAHIDAELRNADEMTSLLELARQHFGQHSEPRTFALTNACRARIEHAVDRNDRVLPCHRVDVEFLLASSG